MKKTKSFITTNRTDAIRLAKYGLKMQDKTLRLKDVRIKTVSAVCKCKDAIAVKVIADTCFRNDAEMTVGICRKHAHLIFTGKRFEFVETKLKTKK